MGTIIIGSSANRKGITIEPSVVLFNGSNVKKIMSGLTTIWEDLKALVPIMTSNTTPYGEVSASSSGSAYPPYKAFDNNSSTHWSASSSSNQWIQYKFSEPTCVKKVYVKNSQASKADIMVSNDGSNWTTLKSFDISESEEKYIDIQNNKYYLYYRLGNMYGVGNNTASLYEIQFYGTQLVGLVPKMTSNTSPSGIVSASSESSTYQAWKAFDGISGTSANVWITEGTTNWIQYQFDKPQKATMVSITNRNDGNTLAIKNFTVQGSDNGTSWTDLGSFVKTNGENVTDVFTLENNTDYLIYRISIQTCHSSKTAIGEIQFYK